MASGIIADKFMESYILLESAILIENMLIERISGDEIPISYHNLLHLSKEATFLMIFYYSM